LLERHVMSPRLEDPRVLARIHDHQGPQRGRLEAPRGDLVEPDSALALGEVQPLQLGEGCPWVRGEMRPNGRFDRAIEVEDARATLRSEHAPAAADEVDPGTTVKTV